MPGSLQTTAEENCWEREGEEKARQRKAKKRTEKRFDMSSDPLKREEECDTGDCYTINHKRAGVMRNISCRARGVAVSRAN